MEKGYKNQYRKMALRPRSLLYELRLGVIASAIGSLLFILLTLGSGYIGTPISDQTDPLLPLYLAYAIAGPAIGFVIVLIPSIICGFVVTSLMRVWMRSHRLSKIVSLLIGAIIGSLLGVLTVQVAYFEQYGFWNQFRVFFSGAVAGAIAGGWYAWKMQKWMQGKPSSLPKLGPPSHNL